jgi:hypothetical protein
MNLPIQWFWVLAAVDGRVGIDCLLTILLTLGRDARDGNAQPTGLKPGVAVWGSGRVGY